MDDGTLSVTTSFDLATATSTLLDVIATATATLISNDTDSNPFDSGIIPVSPTDDTEIVSEGSFILNTFIGLLIVLGASVLNALGLNLTKLDHVRQQSIPKRQRRREYLRLLWLAGMGTYIASQVFGSPLALRYLRPDWVAPLGSSSLVFNFLFAYWLVGTPVTSTDIQGTVIIILGVILIIVFSSINHGLDQSLSITRLNSLWSRAAWLAYFLLVVAFTTITYLTSSLLASLIASRASFSPLPSPTIELPTSRPRVPNAFVAFFKRIGRVWSNIERSALVRVEKLFARTDDARITWLQGIGWSVAGGSLAGLCLVFTKAAVKIFSLPGHPLVHPSALISLLFVVVTAVLQIMCLNKALQCADTVVVVPLFYAGYTVFGFVNSLIFFNEAGQYAHWVLIAVFCSIAVLISGVVLLSLKSSAKAATDPYTVSTQAPGSMRLRPRMPTKRSSGGSAEEGLAQAGPSKSRRDEDDDHPLYADESGGGAGKEDVLWEVGSVSDTSDDEDREAGKGVGVGGTRGGKGERRGLLGDEEEDRHEGSDPNRDRDTGKRNVRAQDVDDKNPFAEGDDEGFGEYEGVEKEDLEDSTTPRGGQI